MVVCCVIGIIYRTKKMISCTSISKSWHVLLAFMLLNECMVVQDLTLMGDYVHGEHGMTMFLYPLLGGAYACTLAVSACLRAASKTTDWHGS